MHDPLVRRLEVPIPGRANAAHPFVGGAGQDLLLLHGGWGDAELHWSRVWNRLAERHRVIAPELPGFGPADDAPCRSVPEYVSWLVSLLDGLGVDRVVCVGNSLGASLAWSLAGRAPDRCAGLVLVNGPPMPSTPPAMLRLGRTAFGRLVVRTLLGQVAFHPRAIGQAFVDASKAPEGIARHLADRREKLLSSFTTVLIEGDGPPTPRIAPLLLWGAGDRLPQTSARAARRLHASLPGSTLELVAGVGHFPQIEAPEVFVRMLERFIESGMGAARHPGPTAQP